MSRNHRILAVVLFPLLLALACSLPTSQPADPNAVFTEAAETVAAQLAANAPSDTATPPVAPTATTPAPAVSATPVCDLAQFVADVNVPDGTVFAPGDNFTKTWRLKNIGVCAWNSSYTLIFDSGDSMGGPGAQPLAGNVAPGQTVDLSVNLTAPGSNGSYRGYWRLRNGAGVLIAVQDGYQGQSFYVDIKVKTPAAPTATATKGFIFLPPIKIFPLPSPTPTFGFVIPTIDIPFP